MVTVIHRAEAGRFSFQWVSAEAAAAVGRPVEGADSAGPSAVAEVLAVAVPAGAGSK